jgi:hypothetical protein
MALSVNKAKKADDTQKEIYKSLRFSERIKPVIISEKYVKL